MLITHRRLVRTEGQCPPNLSRLPALRSNWYLIGAGGGLVSCKALATGRGSCH
ncbi:hypothetical protein AXX17_ATUG02810 (mitochondrion) [Arabidopsis thaliana]|uniref:Uncharacterized protein n=1 Tax=Arabidopsis thaliana TaxID=3702 RepID=A0A178U5M7_ARATH|nr:hypothetical protein AXX17_ATUG02810 [Arabidopsis thaliana]